MNQNNILPDPYTQTALYRTHLKSVICAMWQLLQDPQDHTTKIKIARLKVQLEDLGVPSDDIFDNILHTLDNDTIEMYNDIKDNFNW